MGIVQLLVHTHLKSFQRVAEPANALIVCSTPEEKEVDRGATTSTVDGTQVKSKGFA